MISGWIHQVKTTIMLVILLLLMQTCSAQLMLSMPLKGEEGRDYFITNYVDHDRNKDILQDPFCGNKTYDGHKGTDFSIAGFKKMDSGVVVYAAADGRVLEVKDGNYDRNKHRGHGGFGNYVCIVHGPIYGIYYGHLMKNSILVKPGDSVKRGQPIGKVGSSGNSDGPHLHFEVRDEVNQIVDPFSGDCNSVRGISWEAQPRYDTSLYCIESGFVPYIPQLDTLREGYLASDVFYRSVNDTVCFWVKIHGLRRGDRVHYDWFRPGGGLHATTDYTCDFDSWIGYTYNYKPMPFKKGEWMVRYFVNKKFITQNHFYLK